MKYFKEFLSLNKFYRDKEIYVYSKRFCFKIIVIYCLKTDSHKIIFKIKSFF